MTTLNDFGTKIFLDRYALKGLGGQPIETDPRNMIYRIASAVASAESTPDEQEYWEERFGWILKDWKFVPGGRILAGAGSNHELTLFNCYVIPSPHDSRTGIMATLTEMTEIMSRGGGVGINLSTLRPKGAHVHGVNGTSSGAVSWGELYSHVTGKIEQGGSRRGALMLILNDWHPDLLDFVNSKREAGKITNANISVAISDKFMRAVKEDWDWDFRFPNTRHPGYDENWDGGMEKWREFSHADFVHYGSMPARKIWNAIIESAHASAEPGIWFKGRSVAMANSYYFNPPIATNPCGEQPLGANSVCNLGAVNLSQFYDAQNNTVDWTKLAKVVEVAVRFMDNVIDITPYFSDANEATQQAERRVGIGVMGLAELFLQMGFRYGSEASVLLTNEIFRQIACCAYITSSRLARDKGSFPLFSKSEFLGSGFMKSMPENIRAMVAEDGIRNVTLLTQAPTGTTGTMVNTSTGIEPYYAWEYTRNSRLGTTRETNKYVFEWREANPMAIDDEMPDYFVTAMDLEPEEHIRIQAAAQRYIDSAISKTCNVPANYTVEQVAQLYQLMYEMGCKGGTIYRDGSRDEQVLELDKPDDDEYVPVLMPDQQSEDKPPIDESVFDTENAIRLVPEFNYAKRGFHPLEGETRVVPTPFGRAYITINFIGDAPFEVFINVGKAGSDIQADAEAIGRLISLFLQWQPLEKRVGALAHIGVQLRGISGSRQHGVGPGKVMSLPDAIGIALQQSKKFSVDTMQSAGLSDEGNLCPNCGAYDLYYSEGCETCQACGWSAC